MFFFLFLLDDRRIRIRISGSGSRRPKNIRIRIRNTEKNYIKNRPVCQCLLEQEPLEKPLIFKTDKCKAVLRIHDILGWIRIRESMPLTDGSGSGFGSGSWIRILLFSSLTFKMPAKN
jgi:hypothetical protein